MSSIRTALACLLAGLLWTTGAASAEPFPAKPVKILVPYAAGGAVDVLARTLGQSLAQSWGQQPVVENRPGAGGIVASQVLAQLPADGYTLILVASGHPLNQFIYPKLPYDTFKDFTAITEVASSPLAIVVRRDSPIGSVKELIAAAREKPDALSYAMAGNGTSSHLAGELFKHAAQVRIVPVPYKGGAPALLAVIAGDVPVSINPLPEVIGQLAGGGVRALAVTTAQRAPQLPDVPTVAEAGLPGYETSVWWGLLAPAGLPVEITEKLHQDVVHALADPVVKAALEKLGASPLGSSPKEFDAFIRAEATKWEPVLKAAQIKVE